MKDKQKAILLCAHYGLSVTGSNEALKERLRAHLLKKEMAKESPKISSETFMNLNPHVLSEAEPKEKKEKKKKEKKKKKLELADGEKPAKKPRPPTQYQIFMRDNRQNVVATIGCGRPKEVMIELGACTPRTHCIELHVTLAPPHYPHLHSPPLESVQDWNACPSPPHPQRRLCEARAHRH